MVGLVQVGPVGQLRSSDSLAVGLARPPQVAPVDVGPQHVVEHELGVRRLPELQLLVETDVRARHQSEVAELFAEGETQWADVLERLRRG